MSPTTTLSRIAACEFLALTVQDFMRGASLRR
jgi:hypothetical protein